MHYLSRLFQKLDQTTSTNAKVEALKEYFDQVSESDKVWAIAMLSHRRPRRAVNYRLLGEWAAAEANLPDWLFAESYHVVGDLAETIALLIPERKTRRRSRKTLSDYMELMIALREMDDDGKHREITRAWRSLDRHERFVFNKLITGGLRVGVSQKLMVRALSKHTGIGENKIALRLMGKWDPSTATFDALILSENAEDNLSRPYPFYLAYALDRSLESLGLVDEWQVERKWDGIRGQIIVRRQKLYVWSRGEELVTDKYPEFWPLNTLLPDGTVLDGEILAWKDGRPLPFQAMQRRIGRKNVAKKHLQEIPVRMIIYDLLEWNSEDIRRRPLVQRRSLIEELVQRHLVQDILILSPIVQGKHWDDFEKERLNARKHQCEGLMLKRLNSPYQVGRKRGDWWKWKVDPYNVDAVMIYAQRGHGRRANMYTDFTFGVWHEGELVSFAKAYSGLTDSEFEEITRWVRRNTLQRFGPVSVVPPVHVFELHFEGIAKSTRHKSGIAVRFPRIHRWRRDKEPQDANTLEDLRKMLP